MKSKFVTVALKCVLTRAVTYSCVKPNCIHNQAIFMITWFYHLRKCLIILLFCVNNCCSNPTGKLHFENPAIWGPLNFKTLCSLYWQLVAILLLYLHFSVAVIDLTHLTLYHLWKPTYVATFLFMTTCSEWPYLFCAKKTLLMRSSKG